MRYLCGVWHGTNPNDGEAVLRFTAIEDRDRLPGGHLQRFSGEAHVAIRESSLVKGFGQYARTSELALVKSLLPHSLTSRRRACAGNLSTSDRSRGAIFEARATEASRGCGCPPEPRKGCRFCLRQPKLHRAGHRNLG